MDKDSFRKLFDLSGRTAIVTGGTRGIGLAIAEGFACAGANLVVASRKPEACEQAAARLRELGAQAVGVPTHLGEIDSLRALVDTAVSAFGGIDIVVNNAANALAQPLATMAPEAVDKSFGVNVQGPLFLVQAALPHLRASAHAAVLNLGSVAALQFAPGLSMYAAGKAALLSFTRAMAAEFAADGIRVNAMAPGAVNTDMVRKNPPEFIAAMAQAPLLRRIAEPDEMVGVALLLCSDAGSFITGQTFLVDGGTVAR
ncbi:putative oxidoreductase [Nocardia farcinica]|uniref:SDR family NAD(P)-dependent oxidoreductase n=1 Tax=Nocardia farcinica TaxID=37329 RepID=UPI000BF81DB5|nr:SDR family oxidoreductase [Nocardia farcinica]PFW99665.1 putative oxidoreductase [Nocardia farcinica]PFX07231.1 putative oxidoreductase [Nocardia farcinica]